MSRRKKKGASRRSSRVVPAILALAVVAGGFAMLMVRLEVTQEGYRLSALTTEIAKLEQRNQTLKLEAAELSSRQRLRKLAAKYHLGPPAPGQVVLLR